MFQPFICGAFNHQEEDDHELWSIPNSSPRKSRRNSFSKSHYKDNKNPYSNRGLDKFSALLAELEEKRQKIYSQTDSQDISFVRFMYKNSTDCVPIVVKLKDKKEEETKKPVVDTKDHQPGKNIDSEVLDKHPIETLIEGKEVIKKISGLQSVSENTEKKKKSFSWNMELHKWRRPSYYLPAFLVLILLLLVFLGRSVSILFTCVGWYIVPIIQGQSSTKVRRSTKTKDYVRKLSENKSGAVRDKSSPVHDHRRKS
ncbi:uncharacterized protein LOC111312550 [Durio zibethinus]|uniref:Uncharacterized protein LOC111312550 n=1 Tax=Durio zibethinus TaxID=66656 RepID=A0A6P6AUR5_DURZI|nr:uncharacterized protein LOC111312550 [Durio zibethinus]